MTRELTTKFPVVVPGVGPIPAPGMIIGEAPGRNEIEQGKPFVGRSGEVLDQALRLAAVTRDQYYVTNAYKGDVGSGNRNPTKDELQDHWPYLERELRDVQPKGVLLLGRVATNLFIPDNGGMDALCGKRIPWRDTFLYPCWHPAYTLRKASLRSDFNYIVMKFALVTGVLDEYSR